MVTLRSSVAVFFFFLGLGACSVGEVPSGSGGGGVDAGATVTGSQAGFDNTIKPMVMSLNCLTCHSGNTPPNFTSYQTLDAKYRTGPVATNRLLVEAADGATHNGVTYFSTAQKAMITSWIMGQ